ncbi:MAG: glycosyltransferase [Lacticaseibacillus songhuajiangensis]|nr:glycosyltransferase [Lacticaseibacillus songhuajiangensis]
MIFFINSIMPKQKSGIEHAELKRLELFRANNTPAMFAIRDWDPSLHMNANNAGIKDEELVSMFDYFQEARFVPQKTVHMSDIEYGVLGAHADEEADKQRYLILSGSGQLVARVNYVADEDKRVRSIEWFDGYNNLYRVDVYDARGFVSLSQWYTPDNKIGTETWRTPSGRVVLETYNRDDVKGKRQKSGWRLMDTDGQVYQFDTIDELTVHFLDRLNDDYWSEQTPNIFILDRGHVADWGLNVLKKPAYTVMHLHNAHTADAQNPDEPVLNNNYEYPLYAVDGYDAVVSATHKQTADVIKRFKPRARMFTIPVGVVPNRLLSAPRVPVSDREFGKMVVFARLAPEKHLDDLVRAIGIVHQQIPQVSLDMYGYADATDNYSARRAVQAVIKEYQLEDAVHLHDYTTEIDKVENNAMFYGLTSIMEGFNLAIMEAISHGLIGLTYDVNYGPNEIIEDGVNGNVVPYGDYKALAARMIAILQDKQLQQQYSTGAYDSAERYSETNVWQAWQALIDDADAGWSKKLAAYPLSTVEGD